MTIELLVLDALRYLGSALEVDDFQGAAIINVKTIRLIIHALVEHGSTVLCNSCVVSHKYSVDLAECGKELNLTGIPGHTGSADTTHVVIDRCICSLW